MILMMRDVGASEAAYEGCTTPVRVDAIRRTIAKKKSGASRASTADPRSVHRISTINDNRWAWVDLACGS